MPKQTTSKHKNTASVFKKALRLTKVSRIAGRSYGGSSQLRALGLIASCLLLTLLNSGCSSQRIVGPSLSASTAPTLQYSAERLTETRRVLDSFTVSSNMSRPTGLSIFKRSAVSARLSSLPRALLSPRPSSDSQGAVE